MVRQLKLTMRSKKSSLGVLTKNGKKRGRPKGSKDKKPRKKRISPKNNRIISTPQIVDDGHSGQDSSTTTSTHSVQSTVPMDTAELVFDDSTKSMFTVAADSAVPKKPKKRRLKRKREEDLTELFMPSPKRAKWSKDQIEMLSIEEKVAMAAGYRPELMDNDKWCRYCGSQYAAEYAESPWGDGKLCKTHCVEWKEGKLDLKGIEEPKDKIPIDCVQNRDADYLAQIILTGQEAC